MMKALAKAGFNQSYTLFHLAKFEARAHRIFRRADSNRNERVFSLRIFGPTHPTSFRLCFRRVGGLHS